MSKTEIRLVNEQEVPSLKFGEYQYDGETSVLYVGRNGFPEGSEVNGQSRLSEQDRTDDRS